MAHLTFPAKLTRRADHAQTHSFRRFDAVHRGGQYTAGVARALARGIKAARILAPIEGVALDANGDDVHVSTAVGTTSGMANPLSRCSNAGRASRIAVTA